MRNPILIAMILCILAIPAFAQSEAGKGELGWQYSYLIKEYDVPSLSPLVARREFRRDVPAGIGMDVGVNLSRTISLVGDFSFHREDISTFLAPRTELRSRDFIFLFGPRFYFRSRVITGFGHALFGGTYSNYEFVDRLTGGDLRRSSYSNTNFTMGFGGGLDFSVSDVISIRAVQFDYLPRRERNEWKDSFRFKSGVVFRFGEQ